MKFPFLSLFCSALCGMFQGSSFAASAPALEFRYMMPLRKLTSLVAGDPAKMEQGIGAIQFSEPDYLIDFGATEIVKKGGQYYLRLFSDWSKNSGKKDNPTFLAPLYLIRSPEDYTATLMKLLGSSHGETKAIVIVFGQSITVVIPGKAGLDETRIERLVYPR